MHSLERQQRKLVECEESIVIQSSSFAGRRDKNSGASSVLQRIRSLGGSGDGVYR